ncbi:hypothetical protein THASP1DRAFT_25602 [Thamnocephalis sphaerospora]|uniref:Uncharacterized protein n=1 Tax=Thamnocephalis sphaerospora TaxID=78915 RepID=A0A4P9XJP6_9FUNG|nr:hypothetical protein THASP1DRAFT_25602 [Thamnocephalis sphaerospora]|eukprot:RKP05993.1 hypothetical protein THASP1DRAFT_25602 [Thamnocephalis sphaerospora]
MSANTVANTAQSCRMRSITHVSAPLEPLPLLSTPSARPTLMQRLLVRLAFAAVLGACFLVESADAWPSKADDPCGPPGLFLSSGRITVQRCAAGMQCAPNAHIGDTHWCQNVDDHGRMAPSTAPPATGAAAAGGGDSNRDKAAESRPAAAIEQPGSAARKSEPKVAAGPANKIENGGGGQGSKGDDKGGAHYN